MKRTLSSRIRPLTILMGGFAACALAFALAGCSNPSDQQRIAELEQEVEALKGTQGDDTGAQQDATASDDAQSADQGGAAGTSSSVVDEVAADYAEVADFKTRVEEFATSCEAVEDPGEGDARYTAYLERERAGEALEEEMDAYEERQERAAESGDLSYDEYLRIEHAIDALSDQVERAEDQLQRRLGIYDD